MNNTAAGVLATGEPAGSTSSPAADLPLAPWVPPHLLELLKVVDINRFHAVLGCGRRFFRASCGCGRRVVPRTCGDRLCPTCERRRAIRAVKRYGKLFEGKRWVRFITLTVRRHQLGELDESMRNVRKWFRRLRQRYPDLFHSGVYTMETKGKRAHRDDRGGWHTHVHALAYGPSWAYVRHDELAAAWESVTGGRGRVVDIRAARRDVEGDGFSGALQEVLKYVTKGVGGDECATAGWTTDMVREFYSATKHARLFQKFGKAPAIGRQEPCKCDACGDVVRLKEGSQETMSREEAGAWLARPAAQLGAAVWQGETYVWDQTYGRFRPRE